MIAGRRPPWVQLLAPAPLLALGLVSLAGDDGAVSFLTATCLTAAAAVAGRTQWPGERDSSAAGRGRVPRP